MQLWRRFPEQPKRSMGTLRILQRCLPTSTPLMTNKFDMPCVTMDIAQAIAERFGGFDAFREEFTKKSLGVFGSGFVYLVKEMKNGGNLAIKQYANQDSPVMDGDVPIVGIDLWEHA
jgi:superoxide dismutase